MKNIVIAFLILCLNFTTFAQEFNCKVNVMAEQIPGVDPKVFTTMQQAIMEFVNTRKWTNDTYQTKEKIELVFSIVLSKKIEDVEGGYTGRISIQSKRPIFNTGLQSTMINFMDKDFQIRYTQFQPITFNDNTVSGSEPLESNLSAIIAYYCYIALGLDYDSFSLKGGTEYFNKALNIANNAPEHKNIDGWRANDKDQKNRYWLVDQVLNSRFASMREVFYKYHRMGLDMLLSDEETAKINLGIVFPMLQIVNQDNPGSHLMRFFMNAKNEEFLGYISSLAPGERQKIIPILTQIDVSNASKYLALMK
ncbi:MAG: DUF4835 family protein [Chitinophagaceae bacterium]|nr:DUF4835 family protein [Chitinophagaceae bacterium]